MIDRTLKEIQTLLSDILTAIRDNGARLPEPRGLAQPELALIDTSAVEDAKPLAVEEVRPGEITIEDVREALMTVKKNHGRETAVGIVERFTGGLRRVGALPSDKYAEVLGACEAADLEEAPDAA